MRKIRWLSASPTAIGTHGVAKLIQDFGVPLAVGAHTPEEQANELIALAAEVELEFLIQYLYAAYSVVGSVASDLFISLAKEEMGHLYALQNLLIATGASPHLRTPRLSDPDMAKWIPFGALRRPYDGGCLSRFLIAEAPPDAPIPPDLPAADPPVQGHVATLYAMIYWLLLPDDDPAPYPWKDFPADQFIGQKAGHVNLDYIDARGNPIGPREWGSTSDTEYNSAPSRLLFRKVATRDDALAVIAEIAAQGEGPVADGQSSHYLRLRDLWDQTKASPGWATNVVRDPVFDGTTANAITAEPARTYARIGNRWFEMLLDVLAQAFFIRADTRSSLLIKQWALPDMVMLGMLAGAIGQQISSADPNLMAALPFTCPTSSTPTTAKDGWTRIRGHALALAELAATLPDGDEVRGLVDGPAARAKFIDDHGLAQ